MSKIRAVRVLRDNGLDTLRSIVQYQRVLRIHLRLLTKGFQLLPTSPAPMVGRFPTPITDGMEAAEVGIQCYR